MLTESVITFWGRVPIPKCGVRTQPDMQVFFRAAGDTAHIRVITFAVVGPEANSGHHKMSPRGPAVGPGLARQRARGQAGPSGELGIPAWAI